MVASSLGQLKHVQRAETTNSRLGLLGELGSTLGSVIY